MKKTIIAFMAVAGLAVADDFSWDASKPYSFSWNDFSGATLGGSLTNSYITTNVDDIGTALAKNEAGGNQYWEVNTNSFLYNAITAATTSNATLTLSLDYYYASSQWGQTIMHVGQVDKGISFGIAPNGYMSLVTGTGSDSGFANAQSSTQLAANSWNRITFTLSNNQWTTTLNDITSEAQTLGTIAWADSESEINKYSLACKAPGYSEGANGITDSGSMMANLEVSYTPVSVPEPAVASLSLLGLVGLAMRRRRA